MCLRLILAIPLTILLFFPPQAQAGDSGDALVGRAELNWRPGDERSILMSEFWIPIYQDRDSIGVDSVFYTDIRLMGDDHDNREFNIGAGYRRLVQFAGMEGLAGGAAWFDRRITDFGTGFNQVTLGGEFLAADWDIRSNIYLPLSDAKTHTLFSPPPADPFLAGTGIYYRSGGFSQIVEEPQPGLDLELGYRLPLPQGFTDSTRIYGAVYHFEGDESEDVSGWRTRIAADITPDFQIGARFQKDDERGSQGFLEATIRFPFGSKKSFRENSIRARLDETPERDIDIVTGQKAKTKPAEISMVKNAAGSVQRVIYVDNSAAPGGNGSLESPFDTLAAAEAILQDYDVLYIARGDGTSTGIDTGLSLTQSDIMVIGEGSDFLFDGSRFFTSSGAPSGNGIVLKQATASSVVTNNAVGSDIINIAGSRTYITGLQLENAARHGIFVAASAGDDLSGIRLSNLTVEGSQEDGIRIESSGAGSSADVAIENTSVTNNKNGIRYYARQDGSVSGHVQDTEVTGNSQHGIILYDNSSAGAVDVDLGGGGDSKGRNILTGNALEDLAIDLDGAMVMARNNWWGQAGGPHMSAPSGGLRPQIYYGAPITDGLIGHWTLDAQWMDGAIAYDRSANEHNGTMMNGLSDANIVAGQYGDGLTFDGTTYIRLPASNLFVPNANAPVTLIASFNAASISGADLDNRILNIKRGINSSNIALNVGNVNEALFFTPETWSVPIDDNPISTGTFHQSAVTYNGATYRPYLNGAADSDVVNHGLSGGSADHAAIGAFAQNDTHFIGSIDDVRIYNRALGAAEINEIYTMSTDSAADVGGSLNTAP